MFYDNDPNDFFIERNDYKSDVNKMSEFIARKMISNHRSFMTAIDTDEKISILQSSINLNASLSLVLLSFFTESQSIVELAKDIYRETQRK
jgi:hypothetical protein